MILCWTLFLILCCVDAAADDAAVDAAADREPTCDICGRTSEEVENTVDELWNWDAMCCQGLCEERLRERQRLLWCAYCLSLSVNFMLSCVCLAGEAAGE